MAVLAADIGNSSIIIGIFTGPVLTGRFKMKTETGRPAGDYAKDITQFLAEMSLHRPLDGVVISSVVSGLGEILRGSLQPLSGSPPMVVDASTETGLRFGVDRPETVGPDRIANAVAGRELFGDPVIIADFGTATTITAVNKSVFIGGSIMPGVGLMAESLHRSTSMLPAVNVDSLAFSDLHGAIGRNTSKCIISGIIYGTAGAVERLISEMSKETGGDFTVVITGGHSELMARFLPEHFILEPDLTLHGLRLIRERNS